MTQRFHTIFKKNTFIYISSRKFHYFFKQQDPANWDLWVDGLSHDAFYCGGSFRYQMAIIHTCVFLFFFFVSKSLFSQIIVLII